MTVGSGIMVGVGIALTVFAGPLYGLADRAADNLDGPAQYIQIVFPQGVAP